MVVDGGGWRNGHVAEYPGYNFNIKGAMSR